MRPPLRTRPRRALLNTPINLLQAQPLQLIDTEVRKDPTAGAQAAKDVEDLRAQIGVVHADKVRVDDGDDGVPKPVRCSRETNATRADRKGEDLADHDPGCRAPGGGEESDKDAEEGDFGGGAGGGLVFVCDSD